MSALERYFKDKVIVITGAASGIGRELAILFAGWGGKLALTDLRPEPLSEAAGTCEAAGAEVQAMPGDVSDRQRMAEMAARVLDRWGHADIVIGNAGIGSLNPGDSFDLEIHARSIDVNLHGLANTVGPYIPSMVERRSGHLAAVSSLAAFRGLPSSASYSSTKAAQGKFMESLRVDLRKHGIAVTCLHPGFVETPMSEHGEFPLPFLMPVGKAALLMARALQRRRPIYLFPWQMRWLTYLNRLLPCWLFDRLVPRISGQSKELKARIL